MLTGQNSPAESHIPRRPEWPSGKQCWLRDPVRPCVFWVITGFGIPSAGRGHVVETGVLEPVFHWGLILLLLVLLILLLSFTLSLLPPLPVTVSVFQLVQAKPLPQRNLPHLFLHSRSLLFHFHIIPCSLVNLFFFIVLIWHTSSLLLCWRFNTTGSLDIVYTVRLKIRLWVSCRFMHPSLHNALFILYYNELLLPLQTNRLGKNVMPNQILCLVCIKFKKRNVLTHVFFHLTLQTTKEIQQQWKSDK